MRMKLFKTGLAGALLVILMVYMLSGCTFDLKDAGGMAAGNTKEYSQSADMQGKYAEVNAELDMFSAKASIEKSGNKLVEGNFKYSSEELKPQFNINGNSIAIQNNNIQGNLIKPVNDWNVKLTDKVPLNLDIAAAASQGRFDLSGIIVNKLDVETNASSIKLYKDTPNAFELRRFNLNANAGDCELNGLGNFNFSRIDVDAKASKLTLDLGGEYKADGSVRLKANASTLKIKLPENVGIRVIIEQSNISTVKVENDIMLASPDGGYESKDFGKSDIKLTIYMNLNVTTVNIS